MRLDAFIAASDIHLRVSVSISAVYVFVNALLFTAVLSLPLLECIVTGQVCWFVSSLVRSLVHL